jgi:hypothetical protein
VQTCFKGSILYSQKAIKSYQLSAAGKSFARLVLAWSGFSGQQKSASSDSG